MSTAPSIVGVPTTSDTQALIDAIERRAAPTPLDCLDGELLVIQKGQEIKDLLPYIDARLPHPRRRKGVANHTSIASFIEHTKRFADEDSAVFATETRITTVFDYHRRGADGDPRFGEHRAQYAFPFSEEWKAWDRIFNGQRLSQSEFASFLEDRLGDVVEIAAIGEKTKAAIARLGFDLAGSAQLLTLSRGVSMRAETRVKSVTNLSSGEIQMLFEESHSDEMGGKVKVPGGFAIEIPVFTDGDLYQIPVRIRYRLSGSAVTWSFVPHRVDAVLRDAFEGVCTKVAAETALPVYRGTPE